MIRILIATLLAVVLQFSVSAQQNQRAGTIPFRFVQVVPASPDMYYASFPKS
jgi:hypothetical protein